MQKLNGRYGRDSDVLQEENRETDVLLEDECTSSFKGIYIVIQINFCSREDLGYRELERFSRKRKEG